ncbi:squalene/phytoene synthase family protein, partial [uncultured Aeromicrobium sp.]|uniref:squalene/phytoene synthase family protein n=1 Tax=uncultured Aeromicrobium sp. TaxID=337820 RepID=UPI00259742DA
MARPLHPDPRLAAGYARCAELTRAHGTTYYWGARLLPREQRIDVYTVYALCRLADDIVDEPERVDPAVPGHDETDPAARLRAYVHHHLASGEEFHLGLGPRLYGVLPPESREAIREHVVAVEEVLRDVLDDG